jgi:hypothetical protein
MSNGAGPTGAIGGAAAGGGAGGDAVCAYAAVGRTTSAPTNNTSALRQLLVPGISMTLGTSGGKLQRRVQVAATEIQRRPLAATMRL